MNHLFFRTLVTLLLLALSAIPALGSVAGAHSLQIPPGARANGLGEAYVSLADDASAAWWNPAGLGFMRGKSLGFMHSQLVPDLASDIYYEFAGWVQHVDGWGTLAFNLIYLSYGKSVITTDSPDPQGEFTSYEFAPTLAYGVQLDAHTALGLALKYVRVDLAPVYAVPDFNREGAGSSVALDFGLLRHLGKATLGAALTNIGPNIAFIDEEQSDPLPRHAKLGASYWFYRGDYGHGMATLDFNKMLVKGGPTTLNGGMEFQYLDLLALRSGYVWDPDGDITDFTFGGGFRVKVSGRDFYIDYASIPQASDLDRVHRFSLEIVF